jgi:hypothetical protein
MQKIEEFLAQRPANPIYHYAEAKAAINIIQTRTLWATKVRHLNDSTEILHSQEWLVAELKKRDVRRAAEVLSGGVREPIPGKGGVLSAPLVGGAIATAKTLDPPVYVVSFSEEDNLLSQWRAYCSGSNGYSLGFDASAFDHTSTGSPLMVKCVYAEQEKQDLCHALVESWNEQSLETEEDATAFLRNCYAIMAAVKHHSFEEEREWRIVTVPSLANITLKFRSGRHGIVPFIELPTTSQLPLHRICIGPNSDSEAAKSALKYLLQVEGLDKKVEIGVSDIPFRQ